MKSLIPNKGQLLPAKGARRKILVSFEQKRLHPYQFFQTCDADADGHLSEPDLYDALAHNEIEIEARELHALFLLLDTDRDDRISLAEWTDATHEYLATK